MNRGQGPWSPSNNRPAARRSTPQSTPFVHHGHMTELADAVLPLIRTNSDIHRWRASNHHGHQMHEAVDILEEERESGADPKDVLDVTQRAIASSLKIIMRADDSSGIIGDAIHRLLDLHPVAAADAHVSPTKLVRWMLRFQFEEECDFFTLDPVAYAPALGADGMRAYRTELDRIRADLGPAPEAEFSFSHSRFVLDDLDRRLAVHDRDVDAIIRTHVRDGRVPAWSTDAARALIEIGEVDTAIEWARRAADHPVGGHQAVAGAEYWCQLLAEHRPEELAEARLVVFRRWPNATHAARLHQAVEATWPDVRDEVMAGLSGDPREAVNFALGTLKDPELGWQLAHHLVLEDGATWVRVADAYRKIDPVATVPTYSRVATDTLVATDVRAYMEAAKLLARAQDLAAGTEHAVEVTDLIAELREKYKRRRRMLQEFDRAGLS